MSRVLMNYRFWALTAILGWIAGVFVVIAQG